MNDTSFEVRQYTIPYLNTQIQALEKQIAEIKIIINRLEEALREDNPPLIKGIFNNVKCDHAVSTLLETAFPSSLHIDEIARLLKQNGYNTKSNYRMVASRSLHAGLKLGKFVKIDRKKWILNKNKEDTNEQNLAS
jgi:hypothetical protein